MEEWDEALDEERHIPYYYCSSGPSEGRVSWTRPTEGPMLKLTELVAGSSADAGEDGEEAKASNDGAARRRPSAKMLRKLNIQDDEAAAGMQEQRQNGRLSVLEDEADILKAGYLRKEGARIRRAWKRRK